jgi:hypothetical protein
LWIAVALVVLALMPVAFAQEAVSFKRLTPQPPVLHAADFRLPAALTLPQEESYQQVVFSGSVAGIPRNEGLDRLTAPPYTVVLEQSFALVDRSTQARYVDGEASKGATVISPAALVWQPGMATISTDTSIGHLQVEQVALRSPQGFILRATLQNRSSKRRSLLVATVQRPAIRRPNDWTFSPQWPQATFWGQPISARMTAHADNDVVVHEAADGAVAFGFAGALASAAPSASVALDMAEAGQSGGEGAGSALYRTFELGPGESKTFFVVVVVGTSHRDALDSARRMMSDPAAQIAAAQKVADQDIQMWLRRLPALIHPDPRVVRFYQHAAMQLLYARWSVGKVFILDPWYPSLGLDSGGMNSYAWDFSYSAVALTLLDPAGMRPMVVALLAAPLTEHFSVEPLHGEGSGPFYAYSPYAFTWTVDQYLRATSDRSILREPMKGKTVLEWLIEMAQFGENDRDPDHNHLLDYGDDHNLLEIKTTGSGPGYLHEVPSPNGERAYVYDTLANILEEEGDARYAALIPRFRQSAEEVRRAVNSVLWLENAGWYGARQSDGTVVPVYSIQVFDLLRVPGLVPPDRARQLAAHLNEAEFLGPWGPRSLSKKDRLWDWHDHDWSGPMSYSGDSPQLVTDLYQAGLTAEAWKVLERILWWPEHLAVYPQGIANDDYSSRFPESKRFGGRVTAGRTNVISGCVGVEAIVRGLFGVEPERDGSVGFAARRLPGDGPMALAYPFRGQTWTVTQRHEGLDALRNDGIGATLWRGDGALWFCIKPEMIIIRASARSGGPGRLGVSTGGQSWTSASVNGKVVVPIRIGGQIVFDLPELAGQGANIQLEK